MQDRSDRPLFETFVLKIFASFEAMAGFLIFILVVWAMYSLFTSHVYLPGAARTYYNNFGSCTPMTAQGKGPWYDREGNEISNPCNQPYYGVYQTATQ